MNHIEVESPAKLLLLGEYLALFGHPAFGISLPLKMKMKYIPSNEPLYIQSEYPVQNEFYNYIESVCKKHMLSVLKGRIIVESDIPLASGLGSSAAFCVCIAKILHTLNTQTDDIYIIWRLAHQIECFFHKQASGIDTAIAIFGEHFGMPVLLESTNNTENPSGYSVRPIDIPLQGNIIYGHTQRTQNNAQSISVVFAHIKEKMNCNDATIKKWIDAHTTAIHIIKDFNTGVISKNIFLSELSLYINKIHSILIMLGISTKKIDAIVSLMKEKGCLGGKMSGGGYGGAFYCVKHQSIHIEDSADWRDVFLI